MKKPLPCGTPIGFASVVEPNTIFESRLNQLDLRFTKIFKCGRARVQGSVDVYNVFNARDVLSLNSTYGAAWLRPSTILGGRLFKLGGQIDF